MRYVSGDKNEINYGDTKGTGGIPDSVSVVVARGYCFKILEIKSQGRQ